MLMMSPKKVLRDPEGALKRVIRDMNWDFEEDEGELSTFEVIYTTMEIQYGVMMKVIISS